MIKSFKHKGLEAFFNHGDRSGVTTQHSSRLGRILDRLDASAGPQDMNLPGFKLHELKGRDRGTWAVRVSGNWRITFRFEGSDAIAVDYRDYH